MTIQITRRDDAIAIEGEMSIYFAAEMKEQLLATLRADAGTVVLDLAHVTEIDTCGLQMLLIAQAIATDAGRTFSLKAPSAAVVDVLCLCGLQNLVGTATKRAA